MSRAACGVARWRLGGSEQILGVGPRPSAGEINRGRLAGATEGGSPGHADKLACFTHCWRRLAHFLSLSLLSILFVSVVNKGLNIAPTLRRTKADDRLAGTSINRRCVREGHSSDPALS